jgi:hypothetical protein
MSTVSRGLWAFMLIVAPLADNGAADAGACHYQNLMPEYFAFEARTEGMAPEQRADMFVKDFAPRYPDYYGNPDLFGDENKLRKSALRFFDPARPPTLAGFAPLTQERLHAVAQSVLPGFETAQGEFAKTFTDFDCKTQVGFGISLLHFDGNESTDKQGRDRLLFGIDMIALLHGPEDMPALFAHELFHVYHRQIMGASMPKDDLVTWWAMWEEGLATYLSRQMNQPRREQDVLWFPKDLAVQMDKPGVMAQAATQMLADFDTSAHYGLWFQIGKSAPGLPERAGYVMGLRLAEQLGRDHSLSWLAHLPPEAAKEKARTFLQTEANGH